MVDPSEEVIVKVPPVARTPVVSLNPLATRLTCPPCCMIDRLAQRLGPEVPLDVEKEQAPKVSVLRIRAISRHFR
jgi:hypothetical protein